MCCGWKSPGVLRSAVANPGLEAVRFRPRAISVPGAGLSCEPFWRPSPRAVEGAERSVPLALGKEPLKPIITLHPAALVSDARLTGGLHPSAAPPALDGATVDSLRSLGEAHFWPHARRAGDLSETSGTRLALRGRGVWVYDDQGRPFFDTLSGMWLTNIGHGRVEIAEAVYAQMCDIAYTAEGTVSPSTIRLAARVAALAPDKQSRVFFATGGSESVETALRMAKKFHRIRGEAGRFKFISRRGSYHGATHACLSLGGGGSNTGADYGPLLTGAVRVQGPDQYRSPFGPDQRASDMQCAFEIERAILNEGPGTVAAVIGEPISASAGVHVPHPEYWPMVREICDRYGVLLICDEVITAFGRTGKMFATEHWGVIPDITVVAKALTSGYVPTGAAIATKRVADAFIGNESAVFNHRITFGGNPVSCAAGLANLDILERESLVGNAAAMGDYLFDGLQGLLRHSIVGQVRGGLGLICALEIVQYRDSRTRFPAGVGLHKRVEKLMARHGLLGRGGDVVFVAPPLCVTKSEVDHLVSTLDDVLTELEADLGAYVRRAS
jgi:adenosylmethionine-8-amino-7-oxononanoate aminotransferase